MSDGEARNDTPKKVGTCPICKSATSARYRPFCSKRCADIDLGRWMGGRYAIAGGGDDEDEDGPGTAPEIPQKIDPGS